MKTGLAFAAPLLCGFLAVAQGPEPLPDLDAYVTRSGSPSDFDANGYRVDVTAKTTFDEGDLVASKRIHSWSKPSIGEHVLLFGKVNNRGHSIAVKAVIVVPPDGPNIAGLALIDRVLSDDDAHGGRLVRADGYPLLITAKTAVRYAPPLSAIVDIGTNVWIAYKGEQRKDGVVVATSIFVSANESSSGESKLREKFEYDPAAVDSDAKQKAVSKWIKGVDPKQIPPYIDEPMQHRVAALGDRLIPAYQKQLPDTDPGKIAFRFQLVDEPSWKDAMVFPSGVVLVPKQIVEVLSDDAQLGAVLADAIAGILEEAAYRMQSPARKLEIANWAGSAGGFFVPGLGLTVAIITSSMRAAMLRRTQEQAARVSLGLMQDAGLDPAQAPTAWWMLQAKGKPLVAYRLPQEVAYLYSILDSTWSGHAGS